MEIGKLELKNKLFFFFFLSAYLFSFDVSKIHNKLKDGDIIFRRENNLLSYMFAKLNSSYYSHSGIIFFKNSIPYVIHIEDNNHKNNLQIQTLKDYLKNAKAFKIVRIKKFNKIKFYKILNYFEKAKISFDYDFDLNSKNKLYCTEFVNYFYFKILNKNLYVNLSKIKSRKVILIKNLLNSPLIKFVYEYKK